MPTAERDEKTDGRDPYDWATRWPRRAWIQIGVESTYVFLLLLAIPVLLFLIWAEPHFKLTNCAVFCSHTFRKFSSAWLGGMLGGTLFNLKWLYHSVAKGKWHRDRLLWRFFTPHISGGLAFVLIVIASSGLFAVFDKNSLNSPALILGFSALVGYFSDTAIAKLKEISDTVFGVNHRKRT
jgi:hypothetical protein